MGTPLVRVTMAMGARPDGPGAGAGPDPTRKPDLARRGVLVGQIRAGKNRAGTTRDRWLAKEIALMIKVLDAHLAAVEAQIATLVETREALAAKSARLSFVPGIGPAISAVLIARLPELGQLDPRRIASLAGLAPHASDSGLSHRKRRIWGGRADARRALSIAGFIATRYDPNMKAFQARLLAAGKPFKLLFTACARKLLTILNAMARDAKDDAKHTA